MSDNESSDGHGDSPNPEDESEIPVNPIDEAEDIKQAPTGTRQQGEDKEHHAAVNGPDDVEDWIPEAQEMLDQFADHAENVSFASVIIVKKDPEKEPHTDSVGLADAISNGKLTGEFHDFWDVLMAITIFNDILDEHKVELGDLSEIERQMEQEKLLNELLGMAEDMDMDGGPPMGGDFPGDRRF